MLRLVALLALGCSAGRVQQCEEFYDLEFDTAHTERYEEFFTEESELILPQAGLYRGPDDIREYIKFAYPESPFVDVRLLQTTTSTLTGVDGDGKCSFRGMQVNKFALSDKYTEDGPTILLAVMLRLWYDPVAHKITRLHVHFDSAFYRWVFVEQLNNARVWNWLCSVMEDDCPDMWANDASLTSRETCVAKLEALPVVQGEQRRFDGNSSGCRVLHGVFAAENPFHCAHLSFLPMEDPDGNIKCQVSNKYNVTDFFTPVDLENYEAFKTAFNLPERGFQYVEDYVAPPKTGFGRDLDLDASPLSRLSDASFRYAAAIVAWITVCYTGFLSEFVVGFALYRHLAAARREMLHHYWVLGQLIFPLFLLIAVVSQSPYGYFFLTVGLWKAGSPEVLYYLLCCFAPGSSVMDRLHGVFGGFSLVAHHTLCAWVIVCIIQHIFPLDRITLSVCLPLVVQHLTALVKYASYPAYIVLCLIVELWWEWEVLYYRNKRDYNFKICAWGFLAIHWVFMFDYCLEILASTRKFPSPSRTSEHPQRPVFVDSELPSGDGTRDSRASERDSDPPSEVFSESTVARFIQKLKSIDRGSCE
mmetsp:Transcript_2692/g.8450  ORF Transcript_2692/g.8450 Transcript_2692/m.8450 type:complete len:588 (-) Transcript_2692:183-1946(-)